MVASKRLDGKVFCKVFLGFVLDIMVEGEDKLLRVCDLCSADGLEPGIERCRVNRRGGRELGDTYLEMTGPVLSCVMTCSGRIMT